MKTFEILFIASLLASTVANATSLNRTSVSVPALNRSVQVQLSTATKEFAADNQDLVEWKSKVTKPFDQSLCAEWQKAIKIADPDTDPSFYQQSLLQIELQIFDMDGKAIAAAANPGWTDIGHLEIPQIDVRWDWSDKALMRMASRSVQSAALNEMSLALNSSSSRQSFISNGKASITVKNSLMACDLVEGAAKLTLTVKAVQSTSFHSPALLKASDVVKVSQNLSVLADILKPESSPVVISDSLRAINAAGLLGYQLHLQGFGPEVFKNGEFLTLFSRLFSNGPATPAVLSDAEARDLVTSMMHRNYESREFSIVKQLNLVME